MIIYFTVRNFKSFKDENTLYMTPVGKVKGLEKNLLSIDSEYNLIKESKNKLLKIAAINGQNASGKSNFIEAIKFMRNLVENSFEKIEENPITSLKNFMYENEAESSFFEMSFITNNINYIYSFEITKNEILKEKLTKNDKGIEKLFFERIGKNIKLGNQNNINKAHMDASKKTMETRPEVLFLTLLSFLGAEEIFEVYNYIMTQLIIYRDNQSFFNTFAKDVSNDEDKTYFIFLISMFIKSMDTRIINIELSEDLNQEFPFIAIHKNILRDGTEIIQKFPFSQESEGTKKLLRTAIAIIECLSHSGSVFIVDELDDKIHTNLFIELIKLFQDSNSQFIFATHNPYILEHDLLRKDQIYFVDKNEYEESSIYSLSDFKGVKKDYSIQNRYLNGNYGAVPIVDFTELKNHLKLNGEKNG